MQILLHDYTYAACGLQAILDQAIEQLGYSWEYNNGHYGQHTTEGHQYSLKITNGATGHSVDDIFG